MASVTLSPKGKRERNKLEKREKLMSAAYCLFSSEGFSKTTIEKITNKAGVAKGTFYLFFKDKNDIRNHVAARQSLEIFKELEEEFDFSANPDHVDSFIAFIDELLNKLSENKARLIIISKNLSTGFFSDIYKNRLYYVEDYSFLDGIADKFHKDFNKGKLSRDDTDLLLFFIIEIVGEVGYTSIVGGVPKPLNEMKPILYQTIRLILQ